jgi:hypothetical protein
MKVKTVPEIPVLKLSSRPSVSVYAEDGDYIGYLHYNTILGCYCFRPTGAEFSFTANTLQNVADVADRATEATKAGLL